MPDWTTHDSLEPILPKRGWLGDYLSFTSNLQACARFRFFSACCVLGAAINNRIYIQRGDAGLLPKLFPNPWVMLLGPPGQGNKTQTINLAVNCLTQACPEVKIIADKITPESLVQALSMPAARGDVISVGPRDATALVKAPELSVLFGKQQYNTGMISLVTDLYDYREKWVAETIMRGRNELRHVCISILGGSTPDWLQTMLPQDAFTGGFMSRFVIVEMPPLYLKREGWPTIPESSGWPNLVAGLTEIAKAKGQFEWSSGAKDAFILEHESLRPTGDRQLDSYREREPEQILKVGMCIALSEMRTRLEVEDFMESKKILRALIEEINPRIERLTTHPRMAMVQEIQDIFRRNGTISEQELLGRVHRQLSGGEMQFNEALSILKRTGKISCTGGTSTNPIYSLKKEVPK